METQIFLQEPMKNPGAPYGVPPGLLHGAIFIRFADSAYP
jgi:hypothetical protein